MLAGCMTNPMRSSREEWPEIGNEFAKSLRWTGTDLAATFFESRLRPDFLAAYSDVGGALQLTDVRHNAAGSPVAGAAKGVLTVEYYRSPSVSLKRVSLPLEWSCVEVAPLFPCRWEITTAFTRLP